jgi:hypothetical protein
MEGSFISKEKKVEKKVPRKKEKCFFLKTWEPELHSTYYPAGLQVASYVLCGSEFLSQSTWTPLVFLDMCPVASSMSPRKKPRSIRGGSGRCVDVEALVPG